MHSTAKSMNTYLRDDKISPSMSKLKYGFTDLATPNKMLEYKLLYRLCDYTSYFMMLFQLTINIFFRLLPST